MFPDYCLPEFYPDYYLSVPRILPECSLSNTWVPGKYSSSGVLRTLARSGQAELPGAVRASARPAEKTESADCVEWSEVMWGTEGPWYGSTCPAGAGGAGGPVPGKIGLQSQSVAGPAPQHHTPSTGPASTLLFYRKLRESQLLRAEQQLTNMLSSDCAVSVCCWASNTSGWPTSEQTSTQPGLHQGSARHHLIINCGEIFSESGNQTVPDITRQHIITGKKRNRIRHERTLSEAASVVLSSDDVCYCECVSSSYSNPRCLTVAGSLADLINGSQQISVPDNLNKTTNLQTD